MSIKRNLIKRLAITAGAAGLLVMAGGQAHAVLIDGITLSAGSTLVVQNVFENQVTGSGQSLMGVGRITEIDDSGGNQEWIQGQGGKFLTYTFSGFVSGFILPPGSNAGYIEFTGGTASVYVHNSSPNITSLGSTALDFAAAQSSTVFLTTAAQLFPTNPAVQSATGGVVTTTTLEATLPANSTLQSFTNANGTAFLDATGGDAFSAFHTCSFAVTTPGVTCPTNLVDMIFSEIFSIHATGDWAVSGSAFTKADIVPEPGSLALLGAALVGFGGFSRRRRRNA